LGISNDLAASNCPFGKLSIPALNISETYAELLIPNVIMLADITLSLNPTMLGVVKYMILNCRMSGVPLTIETNLLIMERHIPLYLRIANDVPKKAPIIIPPSNNSSDTVIPDPTYRKLEIILCNSPYSNTLSKSKNIIT
jgi:hypothetical protein